MLKATVDLANLSSQEVDDLQGFEKEYQSKYDFQDIYLIAVKK